MPDLNQKSSNPYFELAENARKYARQQILKGSTQIEDNLLPEDRFDALRKAVSDMRAVTQEYDYIPLADIKAERFDKDVETSSKYSLGNCGELAYQALSYVLKQPEAKHVFAQVYQIAGGDHVFLVFRDRESDPRQPETWGKNALFCDPWKNQVFLAQDYKKELKNFLRTTDNTGRVINTVEDFSDRRHRLKPIPYLDTDYMNRERKIYLVKKNYRIAMEILLATLNDSYRSIRNILKTNLTEKDERTILLKQKMEQMDQLKLSIKKAIHEGKNQHPSDYVEGKSALLKLVQENLNNVRRAIYFSPQEQKILFAPKPSETQDKNEEENKLNLTFFKQKNLHDLIQELIQHSNVALRKLYFPSYTTQSKKLIPDLLTEEKEDNNQTGPIIENFRAR